MKLHKIFLQDFGLFRGSTQLVLSPIADKPLTLIAGMNGAGKTTLLEAVQLSLYGRSALGARVSAREYHNHLRQRIHRSKNPNEDISMATVGVEFEHESMGAAVRYRISRSWRVGESDGVDERFHVEKDDLELKDVDSQHWEDFVKELIPPGISQLFFFDGEKIQRLADDEDSELVGDSIKALLGIDLIERLQADLALFRDRQLRKSGSSELETQLSAKLDELGKLKVKAEALREESADLTARYDGVSREVTKSETALTRAGGRFVENREQQTAAKVRAQAECEAAERKIRALADSALPLAFCPQLCKRALRQLESERNQAQTRAVADWAQNAFNRATKAIVEAEFLDGQKDQTIELLEEIFRFDRNEGGSLVHELSDESYRRMQSWIEQAQGPLREELALASAELEQSTRDLQKAQLKLQQTPEEDSMRPQMDDLKLVIERKTLLETQLAKVIQETNEVQLSIDSAKRTIKKLKASLEESGKIARKLDLLDKTRLALTDYHERLTSTKADQLGSAITSCFNQLHRKGDLVESITVEPVTCAVGLIGRGGREIAKSELSAGEKQMYAVALLWGLAKVSGRELPLIIDTPLGRLDSKHRDNLVQHYFPLAARQIIILSTDTEIDRPYYEALSPQVGRSYRLEYNRIECKTEVHEGYFFSQQEHQCSV